MTVQLAAPFMVAVLAALSARFLQRGLSPVLGTWILTVLAAGSAVAILAAETLAAVTYLAGITWVADRVGWCRTLAASQHAPVALVGLGSILALGAGCTQATRTLRLHRCVANAASTSPVVVVESVVAQAFAVPGKPGHIRVTTSMLDALDEEGRRVLFAHERAHLDYGHHRFVLVGSLAAALLPPLRPLARQITFSTERWADEVAAQQIGDRVTTAHN